MNTRQKIQTAFIELAEKKAFDKITVQEIVNECGMNRNSFYYHFENIPDLVESVFEDWLGEPILHIQPSSMEECMQEVIHRMLKHKNAAIHIYNSKNRLYMDRYIFDACEKLIHSLFQSLNYYGYSISDEDKKTMNWFYKSTVYGLLMEWISNGMKEDIIPKYQRMFQLYDGTLEEICRRASFKEGNGKC